MDLKHWMVETDGTSVRRGELFHIHFRKSTDTVTTQKAQFVEEMNDDTTGKGKCTETEKIWILQNNPTANKLPLTTGKWH